MGGALFPLTRLIPVLQNGLAGKPALIWAAGGGVRSVIAPPGGSVSFSDSLPLCFRSYLRNSIQSTYSTFDSYQVHIIDHVTFTKILCANWYFIHFKVIKLKLKKFKWPF